MSVSRGGVGKKVKASCLSEEKICRAVALVWRAQHCAFPLSCGPVSRAQRRHDGVLKVTGGAHDVGAEVNERVAGRSREKVKASCSLARNFLDASLRRSRCWDTQEGVAMLFKLGEAFGAAPFGHGAPVQ